METKINNPKVSIIISNYQSRKYLYKCLTSLMNQTYINYEIIFVDAGSTDGSIEYVRKNFPEILVIECGRIGIGESINRGIKKSSGDIISFDFNTDEYAFPNWLEELVKQLKRHNYKIVTGTTRIIYGTYRIDEVGVKMNYFGRGRKIGHKEDIRFFKFIEEPVTHVGSPTFHRSILNKIGLVDEEYFLYVEDIDFCYRAKLAGIETYPAHYARSHHHISGTIGKNIRKYEYFLKRAQIRFQLIFFDIPRVFISLFLICGLVPIAIFLRSLIFRNRFNFFFEKFLANLKAIGWNLLHLRKTMRRRNQIRTLKMK